MFDIGWTELLIIGVVALIVVGPKDLPDMFRTLGRFTAKLRSMARDFQRAMDSAAKEAGVAEVKRDLQEMTSPKAMGLDAIKKAATDFEKWDPLKAARPVVKPSPAAAAAIAASAPLAGGTAAPVAALHPLAAGPAPTEAMGPATQALAGTKAAERAALAEAAKLRKTPAVPYDGSLPGLTPKPAVRLNGGASALAPASSGAEATAKPAKPRKPRVTKAAVADDATRPPDAPKPKKPRSPKRDTGGEPS